MGLLSTHALFKKEYTMRTDWIYCFAAVCMLWSNGTIEQGESRLSAQTSTRPASVKSVDQLFVDRTLVTQASRSSIGVEASMKCMELVTGADPLLAWRISDITGKVMRRGGHMSADSRMDIGLDLPEGIYIVDLYTAAGKIARRISLS